MWISAVKNIHSEKTLLSKTLFLKKNVFKDDKMGEDLVFFCRSDTGSSVEARWNKGKSKPTNDVKIEDVNTVSVG